MEEVLLSKIHAKNSLQRTSFDGFDSSVIKTARKFLKSSEGFLFIFGNVGVGKTQFMADMIKEFIMTREPYLIKVEIGKTEKVIHYDDKWVYKELIFRKEVELFDHLKSLWQYNSYNVESDTIRACKVISLLFLDDMGVKGEAPWIYERYYQILDFRYCNKLPTVVSSNLSFDDLKEIEPRVASRVCSGLYLELKGKDRRL